MAVALAVAALSPVFPLFLLMSAIIGVTSVTVQVLVPFAARLAPARQRGRYVGRVMSGLLLGILLARSVASVAAAAWGWRSIYLISAVAMMPARRGAVADPPVPAARDVGRVRRGSWPPRCRSSGPNRSCAAGPSPRR